MTSDPYSFDDASEEYHQDYGKLVIQKSTSDTEDTGSGIYFHGDPSKWDKFDKDDVSGFDDDEILISSVGNVLSRRKSKIWVLWILICSVVVCLAGGLPIYYFMTDKTQPSDPGTPNTQAPSRPQLQPDPTDKTQLSDTGTGTAKTLSPSRPQPQPDPSKPLKMDDCIQLYGDQAAKYSERYNTIRQYLRFSPGGSNLIDQSGSSQRKALCWIAEQDGYRIDVSKENEAAILQRYSLAVLYYSVGVSDADPESLKNSDFLSPVNECDWQVVICDSEERVTALLLSDKSLYGSLPAEIGNLVNLCK
jgi:hypothetical protein